MHIDELTAHERAVERKDELFSWGKMRRRRARGQAT